METLILYHGSPEKIVIPTYGKGEEKHDYGKGFYLTENIDLAKERSDDYESICKRIFERRGGKSGKTL